MKTKERCHVYPSRKWEATSTSRGLQVALEDCRVAKPATTVLLLAVATFVKLRERSRIEEVSERLKELASKASVGETQPWVRIPPSPPLLSAKNSSTS